MKVLKAFKNLFIISGYLFFIILILNIDQIKSEEIKLAATVILFIFIYIFMISELYNDIKDKAYVTRKALIVIDCMFLLVFSSLLIISEVDFGNPDPDFYWLKKSILTKTAYGLAFLEALKLFLKRERFHQNPAR